MLTALAIFFAGLLELLLAAYWTRVVVRSDALRSAAATFASCLLWGFAVTRLSPGEPLLLVLHGLGGATGAALCCALARREDRASRAPAPAGDPAGLEPPGAAASVDVRPAPPLARARAARGPRAAASASTAAPPVPLPLPPPPPPPAAGPRVDASGHPVLAQPTT